MNNEESFWQMFTAKVRSVKRPLSRREKKHAARYRKSARKQLLLVAGHARVRQIGPIAWVHICGTVASWTLDKPLRVPRGLQAKLGKLIGGPWVPHWRTAHNLVGAIYYASSSGP